MLQTEQQDYLKQQNVNVMNERNPRKTFIKDLTEIWTFY